MRPLAPSLLHTWSAAWNDAIRMPAIISIFGQCRKQFILGRLSWGPHMLSKIFFNFAHQLRNGWWIAIYFLLIAAMLLPLTFFVRAHGGEVEMWQQAAVSLIAAVVFQRLRRQPIAEMFGAFNLAWLRQVLIGGAIGSALMLLPALMLFLGGWVSWQNIPFNWSVMVSGLLACAFVAIAEEVVFRGVLLQRLTAGMGIVAAQLIVAAYFWLTHSGNPGMDGSAKLLASVNIFLASIMFGLAWLRTRSLAMPLGLHVMANFVQGNVLGFGVSGHSESGLLSPQFGDSPAWFTGGQFGLEASAPGLITVILCIAMLYRRKSPA